jgi:hypothetical protein
VRGESIERVVIVFPGALGDLLLALPALRLVRARHAEARLTLVVASPLLALAGLVGIADEVANLDAADAAGFSAASSRAGSRASRPSTAGSGAVMRRSRRGSRE